MKNKKAIVIVLSVLIVALLAAGTVIFLQTGSSETDRKEERHERESRRGNDDGDDEDNDREITGDVLDIGTESVLTEEEYNNAIMDFSFELNAAEAEKAAGTNNMISPLSVTFAMGMTSMGASGDTYSQIADVMCDGASKYDMERFASDYMERMEDDDQVCIANSIWINESIVSRGDYNISEEYLNLLSRDYYAANRTLPFNAEAVKEINEWVDDNTDGMIDSIIDEANEKDLMYIINAVAFEGKWESAYEDYDIDENGSFTDCNGEEQTVKMMSSIEGVYYENDIATGFSKEYEGGDYAFVAILPKDEDADMDEFAAMFDGDSYREFMDSARWLDVYATMPAFSFEYDTEMKQDFVDMGVENAFDSSVSEFEDMIDSNERHDIRIDKIIHKTYICLDEEGTSAAAVTAVTMTEDGACMVSDSEYVVLDRPYMFVIVDTNNNIPVFIGTVNTFE